MPTPRPNTPVTYRDLARAIRCHCLQMTHRGKSGHVGSMLSMADLLAVLYTSVLKVDPANPKWPDRDRLILSKGHGGAAVYAVLAERGFFPKDWLNTYYLDNGKLAGHISHHVPGVEFSTGSLGHGLPVAVGMALAARQAGKKHRIFCLLSDGDCNEGSTWEAISFAAQHHFDNLTVIVDYNRVQALGKMEDVIEMEPFARKLEDFRWAVQEIDGHDYVQIETALNQVPFVPGKPSWLLARTTKGKGVSWMENTVACHYGAVNDEQLAKALKELEVEQ
ncbi:MAG: transketolase [Kiritimatiellae bacterium]|nr:transketolase [Verrucomicrobiota bacterium]MCG2660647.1 transketolase [Kiritimatiellia bacterium]